MESVVFYLSGLVKLWYPSLVLSGGLVTWIVFREEMISRFSDIQ